MSTIQDTSFSNINIKDDGSINLSTKVLGVDLNNLVDGYVKAKSVPIKRKEVDVSQKSSILSAYTDFEKLLNDIKTPLSNLRKPSSAQAGTDVFGQNIAYSTSSKGGSSTAITVTPKANTPVGNYTITVNRLAKSDSVLSSSTSTFNNVSDPLITANGNLKIGSATIAVTAGNSLQNVVDAINTKTDTTKVRAQIIDLGNSTYRLSLASTTTGKAINISESDSQVLTDLKLNSAGSGATDTTLSAEIVYNGVVVNRSSNTIKDLIPEASIDLFSADPADTIRVSVETNNQNVRGQIDAVITAYNAMRDFYTTQTATNSDGTVPKTSILVNQTSFKSVVSGLSDLITGGISGISGVNSLRDIGITLDKSNRLVVDDTKLNDAIVDSGGAVAKLFGFNGSSSNSAFFISRRPDTLKSSLANTDITVRVLETNADGKPTKAEMVVGGVTYNSTQVTISDSGSITPPDGIGLVGARFGYTGGVIASGGAAKTTTVKMTQGIADVVASYIDKNLSTNGVIASQKASIQKDIDTKNSDIVKLQDQVKTYEKGLRSSLQGSEENISKLTATQNFLKAQIDSMSSSN